MTLEVGIINSILWVKRWGWRKQGNSNENMESEFCGEGRKCDRRKYPYFHIKNCRRHWLKATALPGDAGWPRIQLKGPERGTSCAARMSRHWLAVSLFSLLTPIGFLWLPSEKNIFKLWWFPNSVTAEEEIITIKKAHGEIMALNVLQCGLYLNLWCLLGAIILPCKSCS